MIFQIGKTKYNLRNIDTTKFQTDTPKGALEPCPELKAEIEEYEDHTAYTYPVIVINGQKYGLIKISNPFLEHINNKKKTSMTQIESLHNGLTDLLFSFGYIAKKVELQVTLEQEEYFDTINQLEKELISKMAFPSAVLPMPTMTLTKFTVTNTHGHLITFINAGARQ